MALSTSHLSFIEKCMLIQCIAVLICIPVLFAFFEFSYINNQEIEFNTGINDNSNDNINNNENKKHDNHITFYLLDISDLLPIGVNILNPLLCGSSKKRLFFDSLYNHSWRTHYMSQSQIIIPKWGYLFTPPKPDIIQCINKRYSNHFLLLIITYFHKLKKEYKINPDAILVLFIFWGTARDIKLTNHSDVSYVHPEQNTHPFFGTRRNIDIPIMISPTKNYKTMNNSVVNKVRLKTCILRYNVTLFIHATLKASNYKEIRDDYESGNYSALENIYSDPLNIITQCVRCKVQNGLQNQIAKDLNIFVTFARNNRKLPNEYYDFMFMSTHFCLILEGDNIWSYRFYDALSAGCIPVVSAGGWLLPYENHIQWNETIIRIPEIFNWSDIDSLLNILLYQNNVLINKYHNHLCEWHKEISRIWNEYFQTEYLEVKWMLKELNFKWTKLKKYALINQTL